MTGRSSGLVLLLLVVWFRLLFVRLQGVDGMIVKAMMVTMVMMLDWTRLG